MDASKKRMKLYKMCIRPLSSFTSPLQSDTFFGAFCWAYRYLYGEERLRNFLEENCAGDIQIVFSNAFPSGTLPLPVGAMEAYRTDYGSMGKEGAKKAYQRQKKLKKCTLISIEGFKAVQRAQACDIQSYLLKEDIEQASSMHNMVSRSSGTVQNIDGEGNLFVRDEMYARAGSVFDVYILTKLPEEELQNVLVMMLRMGIGGAKSTGKGSFECVSLPKPEDDLIFEEGANSFMAISNFIPATGDPSDGMYRTMVKMGRTDREYAAGEYPFKKPLLFIQAGAVFKSREPDQYYGKIVTDVSPIPGVVTNACSIAVPMRLDASYFASL